MHKGQARWIFPLPYGISHIFLCKMGKLFKELIAFLVPVVWPNCRFGPQKFESAPEVPIFKFPLHFWSLTNNK